MSRPHNLEMKARSLSDICQVVNNCLIEYGGAATVAVVYQAYVNAVDHAANQAGTDVMNFLKSPFVRDLNTFTIVGVITGRINAAFSPANTECSTTGSEADIIGAAVAAAVAANPNATEVSVTVNGPSGSYQITIAVGGPGSTPNTNCTPPSKKSLPEIAA